MIIERAPAAYHGVTTLMSVGDENPIVTHWKPIAGGLVIGYLAFKYLKSTLVTAVAGYVAYKYLIK